MQSAQLQALSESSLAAKPQLSEKPRQGFSTKKTASHQGPSVCNFTVTLGLQAVVVENGVRKTYSARYYNPLTGRFMSRDPLDGQAKDPASLHKYLYANGDPINGIDPMGREDMVEFTRIAAKAAIVVGALTACAIFVGDTFDTMANVMDSGKPATAGKATVLAAEALACGAAIQLAPFLWAAIP
jgi:RHS repeat-associated protein